MTEPGVKHDDGKLRWELFPESLLAELLQAFGKDPLLAMKEYQAFPDYTTLFPAIQSMVAQRGLGVFLEDIVSALNYGAVKYCDNGWQTVPGPIPRYTNACIRHLIAASKGEAINPESGLPHMAHAACNMLFLLHFQLRAEGEEFIKIGGTCGD